MRVSSKKESVGGKAAGLFRLQDLGVSVPKFMVLQFEKGEALDAEAIISVVKQELGNADFGFSVRSSACGEDGKEFSFAGMFETYLNVPQSEIPEHVQKVLDSLHAPRVETYLKNGGVISGMLVIIQKMVDADVAGVAFGVNPTTGKDEVVINSVWGLGEGLVSGRLNSDQFIMRSEDIQQTIATKKEKVNSHSEYEEVEEALQDISTLTDDQLKEVKVLLGELESAEETKLDIEFAFEKGKLYLLQMRPVTTQVKSTKFVWDNSNIIESYPGVSSPMTFSFINRVYEAAYKQFCQLLGVSPQEIEANSDVFANMLGLIRGRVYYNLRSWYQALALLPGYSLNARFMEGMMGVKERFSDVEVKKMSRTRAFGRVLKSIGRLISSFRKLPKQRKAFQKYVDTVINEYQAKDYNDYSFDDLVNEYRSFESILIKEWKAPLVNDFFVMIYFGILEKQCKKWSGEEDTDLHNALLCGSRDIVSVEPGEQLKKIAAKISQKPELRHWLNEEMAYQKLQGDKEIADLLTGFIRKFGDRVSEELKLETVTYRQHPEMIVPLLKAYVNTNISAGESDDLRNAAEQKMNEALKGKWFKKRLYKHVLKNARDLVSNRENLRLDRTRAFGVIRKIISQIGEVLHTQGYLKDSRDIFYLTIDEVLQLSTSTAVQVNLQSLVKTRKDEFEEYRKEEAIPERIESDSSLIDFSEVKDQMQTDSGSELRGTGCCPGIVEGKVKVISRPEEAQIQEGEILVAPFTDPGWVTLFPLVSGILVERGSMLSHAAIVSREMGIPCIVAVENIMTRLQTGDRIRMNGKTGEIEMLEEVNNTNKLYEYSS